MPRVAQLIADYKREYYNLQRAMNRLSEKWGGEYKLQLKDKFKTPSKANITEMAQGIRRIRELRRGGTESILKESVALIESTDDGDVSIVEFDPFKIENAYREAVKTNKMLREEDKALVKFAKEKFGAKKSDLDPYVQDPISIYFTSEEGYQKFLKGQHKKQSQTRFENVFMGRSDIFAENLSAVFGAYEDDIEHILRVIAARHSTYDLIVRFKAWYRSHKSDPTDWVTLWDSVNVFQAGRAPDLLRVMGEPLLADKVETLAANKDWDGIKELSKGL